jgi:hypothetical protein
MERYDRTQYTEDVLSSQVSTSQNFISKQGGVFTDYDEYVKEKLATLPRWQQPLFMFKDDCERSLERYFEFKYNLPLKHLRGILYKKPSGISLKRYIKIIAAELNRQELEIAIRELVRDELTTHKQAIVGLIERKYHEIEYTERMARLTYEQGISEGLAHRSCMSDKKLTDIYKDLNKKLALISELIIHNSNKHSIDQ